MDFVPLSNGVALSLVGFQNFGGEGGLHGLAFAGVGKLDDPAEGERVLAIGDSRNDVPMLRWAGTGIAMGNALPEVRRAVPLVTQRCEEDGVAHAIERYVLEPRRRAAVA